MDRRRFVGGMIGATGALAYRHTPLLVRLGKSAEPVPPIQDPRLKELADMALDAARSAGATYADVRLTHTRQRRFSGATFNTDEEEMAAGVRALIGGYWGFASGPLWSPGEMARLGVEAVRQGKANAVDGPRDVTLAPVPSVPSGHWVTPVARDPFEVSPFEISDYLTGLLTFVNEHPGASPGGWPTDFFTQGKLLATSEGSYCSQQLYRSRCLLSVGVQREGDQAGRTAHCLSVAGLGWELFTAPSIPHVRAHDLYEEVGRLIEAARADLALPVKPVEVGRYDAAFDAASIQDIAAATLGDATQLDRAMGFEANESGTSYLNDPLRMLGSFQAGARLLTLSGDRAVAGGAATTKWDDEGVEPDACTLVRDGVLQDFQTTRESAGWLKDVYAGAGRDLRSHGFSGAPSAMDPPLQQTPNLAVSPGFASVDYDDLVAQIGDGIAVEDAGADMDFQDSTGMGRGRIYEVKHGKKTARLAEAAFLFRSTEFWKALQTLGGEASVLRYGYADEKGAPAQTSAFSVSAPPALVKQISLINYLRKA